MMAARCQASELTCCWAHLGWVRVLVELGGAQGPQTRSTKQDPAWLPVPAREAATEDAAPAVRTQGQKDGAAGRGVGQVRGARGRQQCTAPWGV